MSSWFNRYARAVLALLIVQVASGCGSGSGSGSIEPGIEADFSAAPSRSAHNLDAPDAEEGQTFYTAEGKRIDLENGFVKLSVKRMIRCSTSVAAIGIALGDFLVPAASAHGSGAEAPEGVIDVSKEDGTLYDLGALPVEPGSYCGIELELIRLPADAAGAQQGALVYVAPCHYPESGTIADVPGAPVQPDEVNHTCYQIPVAATARLIQVELPAPVSFDKNNRNASMSLRIEYDTWFDGVDVPALAADDAGAQGQLLDNISASIHMPEI